MCKEGTALIVGGGPAGLMAAEQLLMAGHPVILCDSMPSVGRKLLMAGKSGLNLTKIESADRFLKSFGEAAEWMAPSLVFGPDQVQGWAEQLGQELFTGSSGRVFPRAMKASPLLRAWLTRLDGLGLQTRTRWRLTSVMSGHATFETPEGRREIDAGVIVLALGGASWPRLGSNGMWTDMLRHHNVPMTPFRPANMGFHIAWSERMREHFGKPVKPLALLAGNKRIRGEIVISEEGLEGGGIYALSALLRDGHPLALDLIPDLTSERAASMLDTRRSGETAAQALRRGLRLDPVRLALAMEFGRPWPSHPANRVALIKALPVPLGQPQPLARAISTAGGVMLSGLTDSLMLRGLPGVFAAGEMLDWEAPTGGYLLTGCLATGRHAGLAASEWLDRNSRNNHSIA